MTTLRPGGPQNSRLRRLPRPVKRVLSVSYWIIYDSTDYLAETIGVIPSHMIRLFLYRHLLRVNIGQSTSLHRGCRLYRPASIQIGAYSVINRDVLLDGRMGQLISADARNTEGEAVSTLEDNPKARQLRAEARREGSGATSSLVRGRSYFRT